MFNLVKTAVLMAAITTLFMVVGTLIGGQTGMLVALLVAVGMNFFSYWFSAVRRPLAMAQGGGR